MTARFRREANISRTQTKNFKKEKIKPEKVSEKPIKSENSITTSFFEHFSRSYHAIKNGSKTRDGFLLLVVLFFLLFSVGYLLPRIFSLHFDPIGYFQKALTGQEATPSQVQKDTDFDVLILGRGGLENDAPYLTDSIIVLHYDHLTNSFVSVSIPRDLYISSKIIGRGKINEVYSRTRSALNEEAGMKHLIEMVGEITGRNITMYAMIDFAGFRSLIDVIGGVDIDVPERLYDDQYPNSSWGYTIVDIQPGLQHFDGDKALKYARSRHTTSDFDRSKRQQLVITAIRDKLMTSEILTSPRKLESLFSTLRNSVTTNISVADMLRLAKVGTSVPKENIHSYALDNSCSGSLKLCNPGGLLYTPERELFGGLSVILPNTATVGNISSYSEIRSFVDTVMSHPSIGSAHPLAVLNGSGRTNLALTVSLKLKSQGIPVEENIANYPDKVVESFLLYNPNLVQPGDPMLQSLAGIFLGPTRAASESEKMAMTSPYQLILGSDSSLYFK